MYSHLNEFQELAEMKVRELWWNSHILYLHLLVFQRIPHRFVPNEINRPIEIFITFEKSIFMYTIQAAWTKSICCGLSNLKWSAAPTFVDVSCNTFLYINGL
jgi:hypothetical protein